MSVNTSLDMTQILIALIGASFSLIASFAIYLTNSHVKNTSMAQLLDNAVNNALGFMQQAATTAVRESRPQIHGVPDNIRPGVQYVLDHAGEAVSHFNLKDEHIWDKIVSRSGLKEIETNIAVASSDLPVVNKPLDPVPAMPAAVDPSQTRPRAVANA